MSLKSVSFRLRRLQGNGQPYTASTDFPGTEADTVIRVFTDQTCTNSILIGLNDDISGGNFNSRVVWSTQNGVRYYIFVDGLCEGLIELEVSI